MFGTGFHGVLRTMLLQNSHPEDILEMEGFKARWDECMRTRTDELVAERAMSQVAGAELVEGEDEDVVGGAVVSRPALSKSPASFDNNTKDYWDALAAEHVRQYVRLAVEPTTQQGVTNLIKGSAVNVELQGEANKTTVLIILESDNLQQNMSRPWDRRPPPNQGLINKLVQGALAARNGHKYEAADQAPRFVAPCDQDILILSDGGREVKHVLPWP